MTPNDALDSFYFTDQPAADLISEIEARELWGPQVVDAVIDHQRHFHTSEGTRYWRADEFADLRGAIEAEATKEVRS